MKKAITIKKARLNGEDIPENTIVDLEDDIFKIWVKEGIALPYTEKLSEEDGEVSGTNSDKPSEKDGETGDTSTDKPSEKDGESIETSTGIPPKKDGEINETKDDKSTDNGTTKSGRGKKQT